MNVIVYVGTRASREVSYSFCYIYLRYVQGWDTTIHVYVLDFKVDGYEFQCKSIDT